MSFTLYLLPILLFPPHHSSTKAAPTEWPWSSQHLQDIGNAMLEKEKTVATFLDGVELSVTIPSEANNKSLYYLIGRNQQFGFTVTPCTGSLNGIRFHSINSARSSWRSDRPVLSNLTFRSKRSSEIVASRDGRFHHRPPLRVEPLFLGGNPDSQKISKGPNWLKGSGTARLHFSGWAASGNTLVVTLYANPGTIFKVRWSTGRTSRYQPHQGYPSLHQSSRTSLIDVCQDLVNGSTYLNVRWPPAINEDASMHYLLAINSERSLVHHCSLQAMLNDGATVQQANLVYKATQANQLQLRLPGQLSRWLVDGGRLYVNVYAINNSTSLSTSFPSLATFNIPFCYHHRPTTRIWVKLRPVTYILHWLTDVVFEWSRKFGDVTLFLQPCRRPRNREILYNLQIFKQKVLGQSGNDQQISSALIRNVPLVNLSALSSRFDNAGGTLRLRLSSPSQSDEDFLSQGEKVARLFFLNRTSYNPLPLRPSLKDGSAIQMSDGSSQELDDTNYAVEFTPRCELHKITMTMAVSPVPHFYWITTISIPEASMLYKRNSTLAGIAERLTLGNVEWDGRRAISLDLFDRLLTVGPGEEIGVLEVAVGGGLGQTVNGAYSYQLNYCDYSTRSIASFLGRQTKTYFQRFTTAHNDTVLTVQLPFVYGDGSPRFYLVLVYATHIADVTAAYRSLFLHRFVDACRLVEDNCYTSQLGSICA